MPPGSNAFKAIGYREVLEAVQQGRPPSECVERVKIHTRQFSKRQRTWFRSESGMTELDAAEPLEKNVDTIVRSWTERNR